MNIAFVVHGALLNGLVFIWAFVISASASSKSVSPKVFSATKKQRQTLERSVFVHAASSGKLVQNLLVKLCIQGLEAKLFAGKKKRKQEQQECLRELPVFLDILNLGLSANMSFDASLRLYCERFDNALSRKLAAALLSWEIGVTSRNEALYDLAEQLQQQPFRRFAHAVDEALLFGTPLAQALSVQAASIRAEQHSLLEQQIEKVPIKMLIPLGTLIVPAMLLAILGPLLSSAMQFS